MRILVTAALLAACAASPPPEPETDVAASRAADAEYRSAIQTFCDVDRLSGVDSSDPVAASERRENYLIEHTKHPDAVYFLTIFRTKPGAEQAEMLAGEARATKLGDCALATTLASAG